MDQIQKNLLAEIAGLHEVPAGAYNFRVNGAAAGRNTTSNIDIVTKTDKPGIDIIIKPGTKNDIFCNSNIYFFSFFCKVYTVLIILSLFCQSIQPIFPDV